MKLEFTLEFLSELNFFERKYNLNRAFLLDLIEDALNKVELSNFRMALIDGEYRLWGGKYPYILSSSSSLDLVVNFTSIHKSDCTNWGEYFSWRLKNTNYRFKNPELEKIVFALFDKDSVMATIADQMQNGAINIVLETRYISSKIKLNKNILNIEDLNGSISFPKEEIEEYKE